MPSNVHRFPSGRPASMHPDDMRPAFDVIGELQRRPGRYEGDSWLSIMSFPGFLRTNLDRLRAQVDPYPAISTTICCCIQGGVGGVSRHEEVKGLLDLKRRLDIAPAESDADEVEEAAAWFRSFSLGIPNPTLSKAYRQNVALSEPVKRRLHELADGLGMSRYSLAGLSVMAVLAEQPSTMSRHRVTLETVLELFVARVVRRRRVAEVLLETLS